MAGSAKKRQGDRSPKYPNFGLRTALKRLKEFWDQDLGSGAPKEALAGHWGYSPKSSGFLQAVGTLRQYGLLDTTSDGLLKPSKLARSISMLDEDDPERISAVNKAAMSPQIFAELHGEWGDTLPSDATMQHHLVEVRGFRPPAAKALVASFKNTVDFVGGVKYDPGEELNPEHLAHKVRVGDYVQWESQGAAQFPVPRKVSWVSDDGEHLLVEGCTTGVPTKEVKVVTAPVPPVPGIKPLSGVPSTAERELFTITLPADGLVTIQTPSKISKDSMAMLKTWLDACLSKVSPDSQ